MSCSSEVKETGTIIATVYTPNKIYLFSDGRTTNLVTKKIISNSRNKVYKISDKCALLSAGIKIDRLQSDIINLSKKNHRIYVDEIASYCSLYLAKFWKNMVNYNKNTTYPIKNVRIFLFVCGYDKNNKQREFYLDNLSKIPFEIKENTIDYRNGNFLTAIIGGENSGAIFSKKISNILPIDNIDNIDRAVRKSFDETKEEISQTDIGIGGETFEYIITARGLIEIK